MKLYFSSSIAENSLLASRSFAPYDPTLVDLLLPPVVGLVKNAVFLEYASGQTSSAIDHPDARYFMDVGVWAGGPDGRPMTSFGLICGPDLLICSWLNLQEGGKLYRELAGSGMTQRINRDRTVSVDKWADTLSDVVKSFLTATGELNRGYVLAACRAAKPFTAADEMIIASGDIHLHFQADGPFDRFRFGQPLISLDRELRTMLDLAHDHGAQTVQCGDMYEHWECEVICREAYNKLRALGRAEYGDDVSRWDNDLRWLLETKRVPKRMFAGGERAEVANLNSVRDFRLHTSSELPGGAPWPGPTDGPVITSAWTQESIAIEEVASMTAAIRAAHPDLFDGQSKVFTHEILGNHDNNCAVDDPAEAAFGSLVPDPADTRKKEERLGLEQCIWFEHGHHYDFHNADHVWREQGRGYSMVNALIRGWLFRLMKDGTVLAPHALAIPLILCRTAEKDNFARHAADIYTDIMDYEMRFPTLLRADEVLLSRGGETRLVVVGHTHTPCVVEGAAGRSLFWTHPHAQAYLEQSSCLKDARDLGNAIRSGR